MEVVAIEQDVRKLEHAPAIAANTTGAALIVIAFRAPLPCIAAIHEHVLLNHRVRDVKRGRAPKGTVDATRIRAAKGYASHHHVIAGNR